MHRLTASVLCTALALAFISVFPPPVLAQEHLVIGISPSISAALSVTAAKQGFFAREGLDVELRNMESGNLGFESMLGHEIDVAESAIFALVHNSFTRRDFRILATISNSGNYNKILARTDRGITRVRDLKGKRVGVVKGGFPEYVLDLMLLDAGLSSRDVRIVYDEPKHLVARMASGKLDAVCTYGGWIERTRKALKDSVVVFHDENLVRVTVCLTARKEMMDREPDTFVKLLRAYLKAEEFVRKNPDATLHELAGRFRMQPDEVRTSWKPGLIRVTLDQSLVNDLENMARWQIDTGQQKHARIPNYLDFIRFQTLESINPRRVTITH